MGYYQSTHVSLEPKTKCHCGNVAPWQCPLCQEPLCDFCGHEVPETTMIICDDCHQTQMELANYQREIEQTNKSNMNWGKTARY